MSIKRLLLRLVRTQFAGVFLRGIIRYMSWTIPAERLLETTTLIAFFHPVPGYPLHILIIPKAAYPDLLAIPADDGTFMQDVLTTVQELVRRFDLAKSGYRLICNGGDFQDVKVLHFHLISDQPIPA